MKEFDQYSDPEIVGKIVSGEIKLFEIIIRRNNSALYKIGRSYNYSHEDTQDLMQETYINAFSSLSKFENRSSFKTWIIKIMLNNCYRKMHSWNFRNIIPSELTEKSLTMFSNQYADTAKSVLNKELSGIIEMALQKLPVDYRMVFTLREVNGLNVSETADVLEISESNVKVRLNRAKSMLRKEVERSYSTEDIFEFNLVYCDQMVEKVMNELNKFK